MSKYSMQVVSKKIINPILFLIPIFGLFCVIFIDAKWFSILIDWLLSRSWTPLGVKFFFTEMPRHDWAIKFSSPVRGIVLIASIVAMTMVIYKDINWQTYKLIHWPSWKTSLLGFFILSVLFIPIGLIGWAKEYGDTSLILFTKLGEVNNKSRFLMPALAHIFFFRGNFFYYIFSILCNFLLLHYILMWFARNAIPLPFWQFVSLATLSFVSFNFYFPGYPDVLVHLFLLLALALPIGEKGYLMFFALSLATHEASLFIWVLLTLFLFGRQTWIKFFFIVVFYFFLRIASYGFDLSTAFTPQLVGELTPLQWLGQNMGREFLGLFFAFKALWIFVVAAIYFLTLQRKWKDVLLLVSLVIVSIFITIFGIDTSRLAGWAFLAVLFSWKALVDLKNKKIANMINGVNFLNLLIPVYYVSLNIIALPAGLYHVIVNLF
jgi:hypothetical protein